MVSNSCDMLCGARRNIAVLYENIKKQKLKKHLKNYLYY
jgi:hypothetical protein